MGSVVSGLFGGGYKSPDPVQYDPVPVREAESEPESAAVRNAEQRKLKARRAMSGTLLTSKLGTSGTSNDMASGLLGHRF